MKIYRAIEPLNYKGRPIQTVMPIKNSEGEIINNLCISDDCKIYDIDEYKSHDYFGDCKEADINIRADDRGRLYASIPSLGTQSIPRVMMKAFDDGKYDEEFYNQMQVNHIDPTIPLKNYLSNMEWVSRQENMRKAGETGLMIKKYRKPLIHKICQLLSEGKNSTEVMEELSVNRQLVNDIQAGRSHLSVSSQYIDKGFVYRKIDENERNKKYEMAKTVCELLEKGVSVSEIEKKTGIDHRFSSAIKRKLTYKYISRNYNI